MKPLAKEGFLRKKITIIFIGIFCLLYPVEHISAQLYSFRTKNLHLIYPDTNHSYIINHIARCFENSLSFHKNLFNYNPTEEVTVLLQDFNDYGTAGTNTIPWNFLNIGIEPFDYVYETSPTNERMNWVMNHELVHVLATEKANKEDNFFRKIFLGKVPPNVENPISMFYSYLTTPRWYSPRWYHEGIAVFMETWMAGGIGRALGGYDEMVFRSMVFDSSYFYDIVGLESEGTTIDFQIGVNSYLYGTRFVCYLAYKYGTKKVLKWFNRTEVSKRYFSNQFNSVFGIPIDIEWSNWIKWEQEWQRVNLDSIHIFPVTEYRKVLNTPLGSISRSYFSSSNGKLYLGVNYPGQISHIAAIGINDGRIEKICNMPTPALYYVTSLAFDDESEKLFFTTNNSSSWRDVNMFDLKTGKSKVLLKDCRIGDLAFNRKDKSLWGVQHNNGYSTLVRVPQPYKNWHNILPLVYGKDIFDIDISPDGKYLSASMIEINGRQRLILMEIENLLRSVSIYEVLYEFEDNSPQNFVFSADGEFLYGTSYYSGVSNVYRYDLKNKNMVPITNTETGFFRPLPLQNDSLIVFRYSGKGFLPVMISNNPIERIKAIKYLGQEVVKNNPIIKSWKINPPSPQLINLDTLIISTGEYNGLKNFNLAGIYPIVEGYKDYPAYGFRMNIYDPLLLQGINLSATYTPNKLLPENERIHLYLKYSYWNLNFTTTYNKADFYDLFGPTKISRKGYSAGIRYSDYLIYDKPKLLKYNLNLTGYGGLERLPDYQNISVSFDKFINIGGKLNYSYLLKSLGAVEYEQGIDCGVHTSGNYVNEKLYTRLHSNFDYGILLPIDHSSMWFRTYAGYSFGERDEPFANFYFGGFGNNWVDYQEISRYREYYCFPGVDLNYINGTNFGKVMIEWTIPPLRFRRFGIPSFYFRWARLAFFSSAIMTNIDDKTYSQMFANIGSQLDIRIVTFTHLNSTFSIGYAISFEKGHRLNKEFMISLKIM